MMVINEQGMRTQEHPVLPGLQTPACKHEADPDLQNELIAVNTKTPVVSSSPYMFGELVCESVCIQSDVDPKDELP